MSQVERVKTKQGDAASSNPQDLTVYSSPAECVSEP